MSLASSWIPSQLVTLVQARLEVLRGSVEEGLPSALPDFEGWRARLAPSGGAVESLLGEGAYPELLVPWWFDEALDGHVDMALQELLVTSVLAGRFRRFMERRRGAAGRWLSDTCADADDAFDGLLADARGLVDRAAFEAACVARSEPSRVALAAVFDRHGGERASGVHLVAGAPGADGEVGSGTGESDEGAAMLDAWDNLMRGVSEWHALRREVIGWRQDHEESQPSWFLSVGRAHVSAKRLVAAWVVREGAAWADAERSKRLAELEVLAERAGANTLDGFGGWLAASDARWQTELAELRKAPRSRLMELALAVAS